MLSRASLPVFAVPVTLLTSLSLSDRFGCCRTPTQSRRRSSLRLSQRLSQHTSPRRRRRSRRPSLFGHTPSPSARPLEAHCTMASRSKIPIESRCVQSETMERARWWRPSDTLWMPSMSSIQTHLDSPLEISRRSVAVRFHLMSPISLVWMLTSRTTRRESTITLDI